MSSREVLARCEGCGTVVLVAGGHSLSSTPRAAGDVLSPPRCAECHERRVRLDMGRDARHRALLGREIWEGLGPEDRRRLALEERLTVWRGPGARVERDCTRFGSGWEQEPWIVIVGGVERGRYPDAWQAVQVARHLVRKSADFAGPSDGASYTSVSRQRKPE